MILDMFDRFLVWIVRRLGGITVIQFSLAALALSSIGWGMIAVIGRISAGQLVTVALVGLVVGWLVGRTRLKGYSSILVLLGSGVIYLALTAGRIWIPLLAFARTLSHSIRTNPALCHLALAKAASSMRLTGFQSHVQHLENVDLNHGYPHYPDGKLVQRRPFGPPRG